MKGPRNISISEALARGKRGGMVRRIAKTVAGVTVVLAVAPAVALLALTLLVDSVVSDPAPRRPR